MNEKRLDELLAGRALHALSPEDERELDAALAADHALRDRADRDEEIAAALADATLEVAPPAAIKDDLLARIAEHPQDASAAAEGTVGAATQRTRRSDLASPRRRVRRRVFALAASAVVIAAIGGGALVATQVFDRPEAAVALDKIEDANDTQTASEPLAGGGSVEIHWSHDVREAVVIADDTPALDEGSQYELWFVRGETPVSAGVFDGGEDDPILLDGELAPGDVVAVTIEDDGGSSTGAPTTDPIVAVTTE